MKYCPICKTQYPDDAQFCFHDGAMLVQAAAGPDDPFIGRILADRYEILSKLGEGGMGSVYAARHRILGRIDAVKVLRPEAAQADAGRRFLREAKLAARINHPNAVVIHDFGQTESGETFLAMEYIQGQSLAKLLQRESPFPVERVASIVRQVASALDAAHQLGIIHRDLKPDNIMVMDGDRVKVVDFGIAKAIGGQESMVPMTQVGFVVGTPPYMSPEQVAGEPLDARSDVYSLALVAYEMLTGARAFDGDSMQAQMAARLSDVPRPMSVAAPHVTIPAGVEAVVRQALSRLPAQRPASAGAFAIQLEKALAVAASTQAMTSSPSGGTPTQFREATLATGGERPPVTVRSAPAGVGEGFRPPSLPNVAPGASATVAQTTPLQPSAAPAPPAVAPAPQTYPPLPAYPPLPTTNTSKTNVWLIRGVAVAVGIVLLFLVIGVAIYVAVSPSPVAVEEENVPSVQGG
ncbi:MAG: serine/threonine-protein kinase, partial [Acidobacteriota bacterium]